MDYPLEHTTDDAQQIHLKRIKAGSLFRLVACATFSFLTPFILFLGVLALLGFKTIRLNFEPVIGVRGLLTSAVMALVSSAVASVLVWLVLYVGILIWGWFAPLTISYVPASKPKP